MNMRLLLIPALILLCCQREKTQAENLHAIYSTKNYESDLKVKFDFQARRYNYVERDAPKVIEIEAFLFNAGPDTACFLSTLCAGEEKLLILDQTRFSSGSAVCSIDGAQIVKIAPRAKHTFTAFIGELKPSKEIYMGFSFYKVSPWFDISNMSPHQVDSLTIYREPDAQTILWATTKPIQESK